MYGGGIAVLDVAVFGEVDVLLGTIVEAHAHLSLSDIEHCAEGAVLHIQLPVVARADNPVAGGKIDLGAQLALPELVMPLLAEVTLRLELRADLGVELGHIAPAMGEHQHPAGVLSLLDRSNVIAYQRLARAAAARRPFHAPLLDIRAESLLRLPSPEGLRGLALPLEALPFHGLDRGLTGHLARGVECSPSADRPQLPVI